MIYKTSKKTWKHVARILVFGVVFVLCNILFSDWDNFKRGLKGEQEALRHDLSGWWSRRINQEHRLVYTVEENKLYIAQCKYHY